MDFSTFLSLLYAFFAQFNTKVDVPSCALHAPEQIRIAIKNATAVSIAWRTSGNSDGTDDTSYPYVQYNTDGNFTGFYYNTSYGTSSIYDKLNNISWFHETIMNVAAWQTYYYRIAPVWANCVNQSEVHIFTAQPKSGDTEPINITIVGDLGYDTEKNNQSASQTITALKEAINSTSFFLHLGDLSYADEESSAKNVVRIYEKRWNDFQQALEPVTTKRFYMILPGNHEVTCSQDADLICHEDWRQNQTIPKITSQYRNFNAYLHRFNMPGDDGQSNGSYRNMWYSFDFGLAHIIMINTETDFHDAPDLHPHRLNATNFAPNGTQVNWLINDLEAAKKNRDNVSWIIVAGHRPLYTSKPTPRLTGDWNCTACTNAFAQILFDYGVDFYFCGHVHWYERLYPINVQGEPAPGPYPYINQTWPVHITTGAGGAPEKAQYIRERKDRINASAHYESSYGYSQLQIKNKTHGQLIFYNSVTKSINDTVEIVRLRASSKSQPKPHPTCH